MSRYVDIDRLEPQQFENSEVELGVLAYDYDVVQSEPYIDIVRCKECKYARMTYGGECKYCEKWSLEESLYLDGDFFCSYGERSSE